MSDRKTNPDAVDDSIDAERVIPPDTGAPMSPEEAERLSCTDVGASTLASVAADIDATGGANSMDRPYSGPPAPATKPTA